MTEYDYSPSKKTAKKAKAGRLILIILLILSAFFIANEILKNKTETKTEPSKVLPSKIINQKTTKTKESKSKQELLSAIRTLLEDKPGLYSIYISDFKNNESFGINENTIFTAASVNKIPILAVLYHLANKGEIDLDQDITLQAQDIQDGTGNIRYDPVGSVYSYKTLARLMMEKSDNTAAYLLTQHIIDTNKIQSTIEEWGLTQTNIKQNKTSNTDQAKLLKLMYEGKITNPALTKEMFDFMDDSDFEDRIPLFLPKEVKVYHKIGNEIRNTHDVGIVDLPNRPYYIGVFTSDNPSEEDAKKIIAEISLLTYQYFQE